MPPKSSSLAQPIRTADRIPQRIAERGTERTEERRLQRPDNRRLTDDGRFSIDQNGVPKGMVMEWKRHTIMGMEDKQNQVRVRQHHWEPVTHKMQPHILGHLCQNEDEHIIVDGMGLYVRPIYLNEDARAEQESDTAYVLDQQIKSLSGASREQVGQANTFVKRTHVPAPQAIE